MAALLFISSLALAAIYWQRSTTYEEIVKGTLEVRSVPTPQQYKGIDAFVMSNVPQELDTKLRTEALNQSFVARFASLQARIAEFATGNRPATVTLRVIKDQQGREVITNGTATDGFLFLPSQLLHLPPDSGPAATSSQDPLVRVNADPEIERDIQFVEYIAPQLRSLLGKSIVTDTPSDNPDDVKSYLGLTASQVYVITKSGVLKIFNSVDHPSIYEYQFLATTFFPSRPYFWSTFNELRATTNLATPLANGNVGSLFAVSKPYMDLGGNGIVMTLSRGFDSPRIPLAVVCFDLAFLPNRSLTKTLQDRVGQLDGDTVPVRCEIPRSGTVKCSPEQLKGSAAAQSTQYSLSDQMQRFVQQKVEHDERSDVFGSIQRINTGEGALHVSVPIEESALGDTQVGRFLVFSLNVTAYRRLTALLAFTASTTFGIMTLLLAYLWGSLARRQSEYEEAFRRVAEVMVYSPTPYARLGSDDKILDVNAAFSNLVGYDADVLRGSTFASYVAAESKVKYGEVQSLREAGKHVDPYSITLLDANGSLVQVTTVSAAVPAGAPGELPQTFGILLKDKPQYGLKVSMVPSKR